MIFVFFNNLKNNISLTRKSFVVLKLVKCVLLNHIILEFEMFVTQENHSI